MSLLGFLKSVLSKPSYQSLFSFSLHKKAASVPCVILRELFDSPVPVCSMPNVNGELLALDATCVVRLSFPQEGTESRL